MFPGFYNITSETQFSYTDCKRSSFVIIILQCGEKETFKNGKQTKN